MDVQIESAAEALDHGQRPRAPVRSPTSASPLAIGSRGVWLEDTSTARDSRPAGSATGTADSAPTAPPAPRCEPLRFLVHRAAWADGQDVHAIAQESVHHSELADPNGVEPEQVALKGLAAQRFSEKCVDGRPNLALEIGVELPNAIADLGGDQEPAMSPHRNSSAASRRVSLRFGARSPRRISFIRSLSARISTVSRHPSN